MPKNKDFFNRKILEWFKDNRRSFPWRKKKDPFAVLVAEIFLKKTRADNAVGSFINFTARYRSFKEIAQAHDKVLDKYFATLGLLDRGRGLKKMACQICEKYDGRIPNKLNSLTDLYMVGDYSANAVLCFGYGIRTAIVDVNVIRILHRFFGCPVWEDGPHKDPEIWNFARKILPKRYCREYNWGLLDFGALVCTKRNPRCSNCPLNRRCFYFSQQKRSRVTHGKTQRV